jgi:tight adherence protein B
MEFIGVLIFVFILLAGGTAIIFARRPWGEELIRLDKHKRKMRSKYHEEEEVNIFLTQRTNYLAQKLAQAGLEAKYEQMKVQWAITTVVGGFVGAGILLATMPELIPIGFIFGLVGGAAGFVGYIGFLAKQRQQKIMEQLPQVLETMVSTLRAGSPVIEVWKVLAETGVDPIRSEFKRGLVSLQLGKPFREVMSEMAVRIPTPDFKLLTTAIFISQDVGGNLAEVVATIAEAIRERFKLRDYMNALTAQGKVTAIFIGSLPYLVTLLTYLISPGYIIPFLNHPIARLVLLGLILWELLGGWILLKMTTFEV